MERSRDWMDQREVWFSKDRYIERKQEFFNHAHKISSSVRIFYPKFDQAYLLQTLSEKAQKTRCRTSAYSSCPFWIYAKEIHCGDDVDILIILREGKI